MNLGIYFYWTKAFPSTGPETGQQHWRDFLAHVSDLLRGFGVEKLYAAASQHDMTYVPVPVPGNRMRDVLYDDGQDFELTLWSDSEDVVSPHSFLDVLNQAPVRIWQAYPSYFEVLDPTDFYGQPFPEPPGTPKGTKHRFFRHVPIAYPGGMRIFSEPLPEAELRSRLDRFLHLTAPALVKVVPPSRGVSACFLDGAGLAQARTLGLEVRGASAHGGWYRAHDEALDSATPNAQSASRALWSTLGTIERALVKDEEQAYVEARARERAGKGSLAPIGVAAPLLRQEPAVAPPPIRVAVVADPSFDPDATQLPVPATGPVLPFSGTTSPERVKEMMGENTGPAEDAGETVAIPVPAELVAKVHAALQDRKLSLEQYAELRAALTTHGEDDPATLERFGLTRAQKHRIQQDYFARFRDEPATRDAFADLLREALRRLNRGQDRS